MRIGIDCRKFYDVQQNIGAGIERYTYHLVRNLIRMDQHNQFVLFFYNDISPETIHKVKSHNARVKIVKLIRKTSQIPLWDNHIKFTGALNNEKLDLTLFPANAIPFFYKGKSIVVVHDLAIYLHPEWFPDKQWFSTKVVVPRSLKRASIVVTVSQNTRDDVIKYFKINPEKIRVIHPGVVVKDYYLKDEIDRVRKKYDIVNDYILFIGTVEPRKNILSLIKAFSNFIFENEESKVDLILAGGKGWKFKTVFRELNDINKRLMNSRVKYLGKISNRERNILLKNCQAFVFPSYYEGFGFPVLEAMALGAPVVTGDNSSLREIAHDAALLVNTDSSNEIRRAIKQIMDDKLLRQKLITNGRERVKKFTWETTVNKMMTLFK
jgi:glycosyltransferase involved in cell wall biosynthesis